MKPLNDEVMKTASLFTLSVGCKRFVAAPTNVCCQ